jgi:hypothetical protein
MHKLKPTQIKLPPSLRAKLSKLAIREHVSMIEANRRAINGYNKALINDEKLEKMAELVLESNTKTLAKLKDAHATVKDTLKYLAKKRK